MNILIFCYCATIIPNAFLCVLVKLSNGTENQRGGFSGTSDYAIFVINVCVYIYRTTKLPQIKHFYITQLSEKSLDNNINFF